MYTVKFASLPIKYAPKRKLVDFALPQWRNKLGEFQDDDVYSFINCMYQDRVFKTQQEFNEAYDAGLADVLHWRNKPMVFMKEDLAVFDDLHKTQAFDRVKPDVLDKLITKMKAIFELGEKVVFVY
jgi:hypothetical protein